MTDHRPEVRELLRKIFSGEISLCMDGDDIGYWTDKGSRWVNLTDSLSYSTPPIEPVVRDREPLETMDAYAAYLLRVIAKRQQPVVDEVLYLSSVQDVDGREFLECYTHESRNFSFSRYTKHPSNEGDSVRVVVYKEAHDGV